MALNPGDTLLNGQYRILRQIGKGGFGFVYHALDTRLDEEVAIKELIAQGQAIYNTGARAVVLDLGHVRYLSSSGLVAIHSIARLLQGQAPPDPEAGWSAFHAIERDHSQGLHPHLKLVNPQPAVDKVLTTTGFRHMFEVHADLAAAVASF